MRTMISKWVVVIAALLLIALSAAAPADVYADSCDDCKEQCKKEEDACKRAAPKALCKVPGVKGVCTMFKNAQCPAAGKICRSIRCGLIPGCDPTPHGAAQISGDPHFYSLDGARFDLQSVGEFIIARSKAADLEIQARFAPITDRASVVKVAAIKSAGHVIVFEAGKGVVVDQQSVAVLDDGVMVDERVSIGAPQNGRYLVVAGESEVWVHVMDDYLNLNLAPVASSMSTWEGLLGNFDDDAKNELRSRDGKVLDPSDLSREALYDVFGASWRVTQAESFLPYGKGENTKTFTDLNFPKNHFEITDLDEQAFNKARLECLGKGVLHGEALRNCIYDVGVTGSVAYADGYALQIWVAEAAAALSFKGSLAIRAQSSAYQGEFVPVFWTLATSEGGSVVVSNNEGKVLGTTRLANENPAMVRMPAEIGAYKIEISEGDKAVARQIEVTEAKASITAPATVGGAKDFEFSWTGPLGKGDFVSFTEKNESNPNEHMAYVWADHAGKGVFKAPATPGQYEIHYVLQGEGDRTILAKQTVAVTEAIASIVPPAPVEVATQISVEWQGPSGRGDYIDLAKAGNTQANGHLTYDWVREGKVAGLRAPADPGKYVIRYIADTAAGRTVLATAPITVTPSTAKLTVPSAVAAGTAFEVSWTSPLRDGDYVSIAKKGEADPNVYLTYEWAHPTAKATLKAPAEPGTYDVLYIIEGPDKRRILDRRTIKVEAAK